MMPTPTGRQSIPSTEQPSSISARGEAGRLQIVHTVDRMIELAQQFGLPNPPSGLLTCRDKLRLGEYNVLVVGEAKRGKSTFVNALIGRPILPSGLTNATSQVFRVYQASEPTYALRFEDDKLQVITLAELAQFGSTGELGGRQPSAGNSIKWIEVGVPVRFMPKGVNIIDSPGLGSLYSVHAKLTERFVPQADAVIVVLDSERPVGKRDLELVESVLHSTTHLFFIQTMIDLYDEAEWNAIRQRNQAILGKRFANRLSDTTVWPVSSTLLLEAARSSDDRLLAASCHAGLAAALQAFLFNAAGWNRCAETLVLADTYHHGVGQVLTDELAVIGSGADGERREREQELAARRKQFEAEWGVQGRLRAVLVSDVQKAIFQGKQSFMLAFSPGGGIAQELESQIDGVTSLAQANQLGPTIADAVVAATMRIWQQTCAGVHARCVYLLEPFAAGVSIAGGLDSAASPDPRAELDRSKFKNDWWLRLRGSYSSLFVLVGISHLFPPALPLVYVGAIWTIRRGWKDASKMQVATAQAELRKHLNAVLQQVRRHFFDVDLSSGRGCLVDGFFNDVERLTLDRVQEILVRESAAFQDEAAKFAQWAKLDDQQKSARAQQIRMQIADWAEAGRMLQASLQWLQAHAPAGNTVAPSKGMSSE
jgi:GTP-binding protein EngB required for normal cell division